MGTETKRAVEKRAVERRSAPTANVEFKTGPIWEEQKLEAMNFLTANYTDGEVL